MEKSVIVKSNSGEFKGYVKDNIICFNHIPYANKPIKEKRFKRSELITKYNKVVDCKDIKGNSYQFGPNFDGDTTYKQSLDCLYLNVCTNNVKSKKPVFVWIHGGGFMTGCNCYPMYDGKNIASQDVVYVSINYRLGCFGYVNLSKYSSNFDSNCGLSDQINALRWVKENIEAFGGDSNNITICGESAGGISVFALLSSPKTEGLFNKAIVESGLAYCVFNEKYSSLYAKALLNVLNVKDDEVDSLLTMNARKLVKAQMQAAGIVSNETIGCMTTAPVIDDLLPYDVIEACERKINKDVKILVGTNKDEGTFFCNPSPYSGQPWGWDKIKLMLENNNCGDLFDNIKEYYNSNFPEGVNYQEFTKDNLFLRGSIDVCNLRKQYSDVYMFRFDYETPITKKMGVRSCHSLEMTFALGTTLDHMCGKHPLFKEYDKDEIQNVMKQMNGAWMDFSKTGSVSWEKYNDNQKAHVFNVTPSEISYKNFKPLDLFKGRRINTK